MPTDHRISGGFVKDRKAIFVDSEQVGFFGWTMLGKKDTRADVRRAEISLSQPTA